MMFYPQFKTYPQKEKKYQKKKNCYFCYGDIINESTNTSFTDLF